MSSQNQQTSFKSESYSKSGRQSGQQQQMECQKSEQRFGGKVESQQKVECHSMESSPQQSVEEMERRARELREEAEIALKRNTQEFAEANAAQNAARIASEVANVRTEKALQNQERGQQLLAEAGAQMIEAGARLQQEASAEIRQVPFNVHAQGEVRQTTCVSAAGVEAAAKAHEVTTFREVEHFPAKTV